MTLPEITLDDRRFQDLVNEARRRIVNRCPEWTEHNVSDPGITLIELFAWMTETIIYRLNRIPEKLHVALLNLLDIRLSSPSAATADLRFRLAAPPTEPIELPAETEVGTIRTARDESIVFQTDEGFTIPPARLTIYAVQRGGDVKDVGVGAGEAQPEGPDQLPFGTPPQVGDALYLGFDASLARVLLTVAFECSQARGAGIVPTDPPLAWEVSSGGTWAPVDVLDDRTGGFNYGSGMVELQLPPGHTQADVGGLRSYWLRCRVAETTPSGAAGGGYTQPPEIYRVAAATSGALIPATHATREHGEELGTSDGTPAQVFRLAYAPVLQPRGETLEVLEPDAAEWQEWEPRESFVESEREDRHFVLDPATGEVELGPAIRHADGEWRYYGAIPPKGARLRFSSYRHGGGIRGNVAPDLLTVMKSAIPGVASVTNPRQASGGVDAESLESARHRAAMELRTRYRAVTAEDFEFLATRATRNVHRARCVAPIDGAATVQVHLIPRLVGRADRRLTLEELHPDESLLDEVAEYLDERRLVGTRVELLPAGFRGVKVIVNVQASHRASLRRVEDELEYALYTYLNPLVGGSPDGPADGWPFGRTLNQGELYGIVHSIEGVEFVKLLRVYEADLATGKPADQPVGSHMTLEPHEVIASGPHEVRAEYAEA